MKRALLILVVAVAAMLLVGGLDELADLTQTRPDRVDDTRSSVVVFDVRTRAYDGPTVEAAAAQWGVCAGTIGSEVTDPGLEQLDDTHFRVTVNPAVGPRGTQRLRGCLNDAAVDRVLSSVVSIDEIPAR